ncbi:NUDIX hydrolase [Lunatibacter salilacus]|uniref:NUDIX hydrolase n=1 Tax=Lunatibacter salilacus TaxID=2483804 RepID=UPI00131B01E3|nr:CoA pyrophosphatase [Lunatibacter salilacus]
MKFDTVLKHLSEALKHPLPGKVGQLSMAPLPLNEDRFASMELPNARKGAVLLLLYPDDEGCMVPFIKRSIYEGTHAGQISLPGGKWEPSDASLEYTAQRETEEEIGVQMDSIKILGRLSRLYIPPSNYLVEPFVGYVESKPKFSPDPREVDRVVTCSFAHLINRSTRKQKDIIIRKDHHLSAPYFDIDNEVVWGATAMILGEFLHLWEKEVN